MRSTTTPAIVNDVHSGLNRTAVSGIVPVRRPEDVALALSRARARSESVAVCGGRHAMGGQQFASGSVLLDTRPMRKVLHFDRSSGLVMVEAGIYWSELVAHLAEAQADGKTNWGIAQKQTGADRFSLGGSVSANAHGRGLTMAPLGSDVESLRVALPDGSLVRCSRTERPKLFSLVLGGYGLFGVIVSVTLRLVERTVLRRDVRLAESDELADAFADRIDDGYTYGDFQFDIDATSSGFLRRGIFSCYRPVDPATPVRAERALTRNDWGRLLQLAHVDKSRAFDEYAAHYLATSGQTYWSDRHQLADYVDGYHAELPGVPPGSEMIGEMYVPRARLADYLAAAATALRDRQSDVIYGTARLIERDVDSFLPWARRNWACIVFNLHTGHDPAGVASTVDAFRALIDLAIERGGSHYLTYSRWARPDQVAACYPRTGQFLQRKLELDPTEVLTSDWYRAQRHAFDGASPAALQMTA